MKRALAGAGIALIAGCFTGCSSPSTASVASAPTQGTGGVADDPPAPPTTWPTGTVDGGPPKVPSPLILAHGWSGFHNIGPLDYFYGVPDALRADGHNVFITQVDPYNTSYVRGAELLTQVQAILDETGADHVNMICHSQGALDCRYVANKLGKRVGAVVLISGVNRGTPVADVALGVLPGPVTDAVAALLQLFGDTLLDPGGKPDSNATASFQQLSTAGAAQFNADFPDSPDVDYYSVAGRSNNSNGDINCSTAVEPGMIGQYDNKLDATQVLLQASAAVINAAEPIPPVNDGLVPASSARWGTFLGCIPADHMQEVCQLAGSATSSGFNCVTFYRQLANWLDQRGY